MGSLFGCWQGEKIFILWLHQLQIVKEKDRFRKAPPNYAMKKTQLLKDKVMWEVSGCLQQRFTRCLSVLSAIFFRWGEGYGRRERWRWPSEGDPGWAERAGGEGRSTRQTEDQEHLCHQVPKPHSHMLSRALWASAALNKNITTQKTPMTISQWNPF